MTLRELLDKLHGIENLIVIRASLEPNKPLPEEVKSRIKDLYIEVFPK